MIQVISPKTSAQILSVVETFEFTKNLDEALRTVDFEKLKDTFSRANLLSHPETDEFLLQGEHSFKMFNNPEKGIKLLNIEDRNTKCSACTLGKTVKAYDVEYKKRESIISVVYSSSFAVKLEIINGELYDFSWCNFFLNKEEYKEIYS